MRAFAIAGLSGSGKTTAVKYIGAREVITSIYLGKFVLDELDRRGLERNPENEKLVRFEFRERLGPAAMIIIAEPVITYHVERDESLVIDAVFGIEEYKRLKELCAGHPVILLGIEASFDVRCQRHTRRALRPYSVQDLKRRDEDEIGLLGTNSVVNDADYTITNEGSLETFQAKLAQIIDAVGNSRG